MPYPTKKLGEVVDFLDNLRKPVTASDRVPGPYPYYGANGQQDSVNDYIFDEDLVLLAEDGGYFGSKDRPIAYRISGKTWVNNHAHVLRVKRDIAEIGFIYYRLMFYDIKPYITGSTRTKLNKSAAEKIKIPLPPLPTQKQIVERLDKIAEAQKLNDELIQKTDELFQSLLHKELNPHTKKFGVGVNPAGKGWEVKKLGDIAEVKGGKRIPKGMNFSPRKTNHPYLRVTDFVSNSIEMDGLKYIDEKVFKHIERYIISSKNIYISIAGTIGLVGKIPPELEGANLTENAAKLLVNEKNVDQDFLIFCLSTNNAKSQIKIFTQAVGVPKLALERIEKIKIPLPPLKIQKQIVAKLSAVQNYKKQLLEQKSKLKELFDASLAKSMKN